MRREDVSNPMLKYHDRNKSHQLLTHLGAVDSFVHMQYASQTSNVVSIRCYNCSFCVVTASVLRGRVYVLGPQQTQSGL